jgi:Tfp pilus assembly major pilin PilA
MEKSYVSQSALTNALMESVRVRESVNVISVSLASCVTNNVNRSDLERCATSTANVAVFIGKLDYV